MGFLNNPLFSGLNARYQRLAQGESSSTYRERGRGTIVVEKVKDVVVRTSLRLRVLLVGGLLCIVLLLTGGKWYTTPQEIVVPIVSLEPGAQYLHLLVTSPKASLSTCRLVVSAGTNHYPTPNMVSWGNTYNASAQPPTSPSVIKVQSVLDFFGTMGPERGNDVVLIPDPEGTVLQLRPDVLMERYFEIIRIGQERARKGMVEVDQNNTSHKIIFGASKLCSLEKDDVACYAAPESPLPSKVYGSKTDKLDAKDEFPELHMRERYLSTSFVMGELKAVRSLYEKALPQLQADPSKATEQDVIARIFGEQEYYRATLRQKTAPKSPSIKQSISKFFGFSTPSPVDPHPTHRRPEIVNGTQYDFHIALDYEGLLSSDSVSSKTMGFVQYNNSGSIRAARSKAGVSKSGFVPLPQDIGRSVPPFWSRMPAWDKYPFRLGWKDVSLYTNLWSGSIPATFHQATPITNVEDAQRLKGENWSQMWFYQHTRQKLKDYATSPDRRFVTLRGGGAETAWWSIWREKWKFRRSKNWAEGEEKKEWVEWSEVCDPYWAEVLAEGDGRAEGWKVPISDW